MKLTTEESMIIQRDVTTEVWLCEKHREWNPEPKSQLKPFEIGTRYKMPGKRGDLCTITDIFRTYNANGELVRIQYQSTHEFAGQLVTNNEVPMSTVARNLIVETTNV